MRLTRIALFLAATGTATLGFADDAQSVNLPSLVVKERLQSIEQINVTAEKEAQVVEPVSEAVAELLSQADELDQLAEK